MPYKPHSLLSQLIQQLTYHQGYTLCIHDVSGIIHKTPELQLESKSYAHYSSFCSKAKLTHKGYQQCLRCKSLTILKAQKSTAPFVGQCYLGITEIVYPVYHEEQLQCILYLGNLLDTTTEGEFQRKLRRNAPLIGLNAKDFKSLKMSLHPFTPDDYAKYLITLSFIEDFIFFIQTQQEKAFMPSNSTAPIYRERMHPAIRQASDYISVHYCKLITLNTLSDLCYLNPEYFSKLFKKETGISVTQYIQSIRIERAKELLRHTDEKIIDVSLAVGFNNPSYFCRLFKRLTGISASLYRSRTQQLQ